MHYHVLTLFPEMVEQVMSHSITGRALQKSDDNARMQLAVIGWDEDTKAFLLEAIRRMQVAASDSYKWSMQKWWKEVE